ncbi:MAG: hypothetical protein ACHQRM_05455 [Bacteroidia bacterium]
MKSVPLFFCLLFCSGLHAEGYNNGKKGLRFSYYFGVGMNSYIPLITNDQPGYSITLGFDIRLFAVERFNVRAGLGVEEMVYTGRTTGGNGTYSVSESMVNLPVSFIYRVSAQQKRYVSVKLGVTESMVFAYHVTDISTASSNPFMLTFVNAGMIYKIRKTNNGGPAIYLEPELKYQVTPNPDVQDSRALLSFMLKLRIAAGN